MPRQRKKGIKGNGSVFQRKDGRWVAQFLVEGTGKTKQLYAATEKEANEKLQKALQEQRQGILATGPKQKLGDHLNYWLEEVKRQKLRESTYQSYRIMIDTHINPKLGNIPLHKLTTQTIQAFYNNKAKEHQNKTKEHPSSGSVHIMHTVLHQALKYATQVRLIAYNPSDNIVLPKRTKRKVKPFTLEQSRHLIQAAQGSHLEMLITLALFTGMRHGELVTLRWEDINFENASIYVHRTGRYWGKGRFIEGDPKTEAGERIIPISHKLCDELKRYQSRQKEMRLKARGEWNDIGLVCCNTRNGGFLNHANARKSFYLLLEKANLPRIHIHDLRHTASTLMRSMGIDLKVIQEILGHSNMDMTANVYSHVLPEMQTQAAEKMNRLLKEPLSGD
ncbi:tyrosine-type recombinase/integrase [Dictyobacter arantiisoli]|uniref:Site-specific integrase n=1 Tax=Dictyobacter arantiisoli TaxID=2014874 RepID=A0A5A5T792_9CHLR|nr:tyrosine-type recombinase/integrase [Dictyobacter arantiisoli]GCF07351.1 site-specific integrase [Dictyobacter arantiisoli]